MTTQELRISRWAAGQMLVLALFLAGHLGVFIWWSGRITAEVRNLKEQVHLATADRYTRTEAMRELDRLDRRVEALAERVGSWER